MMELRTVADVSLAGVTVTFTLILSDDCKKLTIRFEDKNLYQFNVKVEVAPA